MEIGRDYGDLSKTFNRLITGLPVDDRAVHQ